MKAVEGRTDDLTAQQWRAVQHLLRTGDPAKTAEHVGIAERTLRKWRANDTFKTALRTAGRDAARETASRVMSVQNEAVTALVSVLRSDRAPWATKVAAAGKLLDHGDKIASDDTDERLADLERRAAAWHDTPAAWTA